MKSKNNKIFKEVLEKIKPSKEELKFINSSLSDFLKKVNKKIKVKKLKAEIFIGGSFAKNTLIKKDHYDIDIFIRYDAKYKDNDLSGITEKILGDFKDILKIHGSRDYFVIKIKDDLFFEVVPVKKIKNQKEAVNITDLSYSHVKYIKNKIKSDKILDEIRIAKAFCYSNNCYGAESYINGFSGYALELLIYYYKSFEKFLKEMVKVNHSDKLVIDIEKYYKNKHQVMMDLNSAKLHSPVILIDPTYKQRNALAALSKETLENFKKEARVFLKKPSIKSFEIKKLDLASIKKSAEKKKNEFILIETKTDKQEGDIAGSKLLKFFRHLENEIKKFFDVKNKGFNYNKNQSARYFFVVKNKGEIIVEGPNREDKENVLNFKKKHKNIFTKSKKIYAKEKINFSLKKFIEMWKERNQRKIEEMSITGLEIIE